MMRWKPAAGLAALKKKTRRTYDLPKSRNGTESAFVITAFSYTQVRRVTRSKAESIPFRAETDGGFTYLHKTHKKNGKGF